MNAPIDKTAIRDAATVIVLRHRNGVPHILMGQRGASAAFMPNKFVFPGGAVDANDETVPLGTALPPDEHERLSQDSTRTADALAAAAIRELWEETGQILGTPATWADAPQGWRGFAASGYQPNAAGLNFIFRAITPKGRPRRFDARFFVVEADQLVTDLDDFSRAEEELSHLHWVALAEARSLDLPFITEVVLAELTARLKRGTPAETVPFYRDREEEHLFTALGGKSPLDP